MLAQQILTQAGAPVFTGAGAPLRVAVKSPQGSALAQSIQLPFTFGLLTSQGIPLRTRAGALVQFGRLLTQALIPILPDPQMTRVARPWQLKTSNGAPIFTSIGTPLQAPMPLPAVKFLIAGTTFDSTGAALPGCVVSLYLTSTKVFIDTVTSDSNGNYSFSTAGPSEAYFIVAYLPGSPDVSGTTVNTLTGSA